MSDSSSKQIVVFSLGSEEYALPIGSVHEIIRYSEPRAVASSVPWIRGAIGLRGKIIPIYDLAARLGLEPTGTEPGKIVIVESGAGQAGVMVDDVDQVLVVVVSAFSPAHGARAVDALAEGAFDLVAKPAAPTGMDAFASELGRKVGDAAHATRVRRPSVADELPEAIAAEAWA